MGLTLNKLLLEKGYIAIPLELTLTQHLIVQAKINGIEGRFILDSGASNTCVGIEWITYFNLQAEASFRIIPLSSPSTIIGTFRRPLPIL